MPLGYFIGWGRGLVKKVKGQHYNNIKHSTVVLYHLLVVPSCGWIVLCMPTTNECSNGGELLTTEQLSNSSANHDSQGHSSAKYHR